jgi:hypothetical protein
MADNTGFSWGSALLSSIPIFGSLWGAHEQASAATEAANITSQAQTKIAEMNAAAQKYAADLEAKAAADALGFSKSGAENAFQNNEVSRAGNYDQWAAAQRRIGSVGKLVGFGDREIPTYRPGVDPNFTGAGGGSAPSRPLASFDPNVSDPSSAISAYFKAQGVSDQETPYWVSKWPELLARGQELNDPQYALKRLAAADVFRGAPTSAPGASMPVNPYAVSSFLS